MIEMSSNLRENTALMKPPSENTTEGGSYREIRARAGMASEVVTKSAPPRAGSS